jgi:hypothetical protein
MYSSHRFYIDHFLFSGKYNLAALERGQRRIKQTLETPQRETVHAPKVIPGNKKARREAVDLAVRTTLIAAALRFELECLWRRRSVAQIEALNFTIGRRLPTC